MRSVNKVILIGNLTRDPEMRQTPNGQVVTTFGLATNREWNTRDHQKHNLAEFHDLVAWAKLAEICHKHLKKGKLVYVEGYLKTRSWDTPEGVKKFKTEIVIQDMIMLDKRPAGEEAEYIPEEDNGGSSSNTQAAHAPITNSVQNPPSEPKVHLPPKTPARKIDSEIHENKSEQPQKKVNIDINDDLGL